METIIENEFEEYYNENVEWMACLDCDETYASCEMYGNYCFECSQF